MKPYIYLTEFSFFYAYESDRRFFDSVYNFIDRAKKKDIK